jgi:hypothetical protein
MQARPAMSFFCPFGLERRLRLAGLHALVELLAELRHVVDGHFLLLVVDRDELLRLDVDDRRRRGPNTDESLRIFRPLM